MVGRSEIIKNRWTSLMTFPNSPLLILSWQGRFVLFSISHELPFEIKAICERSLTEKMVKSAGAWGVNHALNSLTFVVLRRKKSFLLAYITQGVIDKLRWQDKVGRCQVVVHGWQHSTGNVNDMHIFPYFCKGIPSQMSAIKNTADWDNCYENLTLSTKQNYYMKVGSKLYHS